MGDGMNFTYPEGATPLEYEELLQLVPPHITTQAELNLWEQNNILLAERWAFKKKQTLSAEFIQKLHQKMFDKTWKWAGQYRRSEKNIGIESLYIPIEVRKLCDDALYQIEHQSYNLEEIAVRLHHRLVWIHPFPNGNGRHARLVADFIVLQHEYSRFSWGRNQEVRGDLYHATPIREQYIKALRRADQHDYSSLIEFARS